MPLDLDAQVPCASCGAEVLWRVTTDDDDVVTVIGWCSSCSFEWTGVSVPMTWRTLATCGHEIPAAYAARLVAEVDRLTAERFTAAWDTEEMRDDLSARLRIAETEAQYQQAMARSARAQVGRLYRERDEARRERDAQQQAARREGP